jgi:hypothetical protein
MTQDPWKRRKPATIRGAKFFAATILNNANSITEDLELCGHHWSSCQPLGKASSCGPGDRVRRMSAIGPKRALARLLNDLPMY